MNGELFRKIESKQSVDEAERQWESQEMVNKAEIVFGIGELNFHKRFKGISKCS